MALYLKKLAVLDIAAGQVASLVNVMEGAEGSATFGYNAEDEALVVANGQKMQYGQTHRLDLSILPPTGTDATRMNTLYYATEPRLVRVAGCSDDTFLLWDAPAYLTQNPEYGDTLTRHLMASLSASPGYAGTAPAKKYPVYAGGNLLGLYDVLSGSASVLNGFAVNGTLTASVAGAAQTLTRAGDAGAVLYSQLLFFPFPGETITVSMFVNSANAGYSFGFYYYNESGAQVASDVTSTTGATSRKSYTSVVPDTTAFIRAVFAPGATAANNLVFQAPAVRMGTLSAYTN